MKILEIFDSIQGEGSWMGIPVTFIRTAGCSLHCSFCDTKESWAEGKVDMGIDDILKQVKEHHVVITGGEPTEQAPELRQLINRLQSDGHVVAIESNGTFEHYEMFSDTWVVVSPKPAAMYCVYPEGVSELKYVVTEEFNADVAIPEAIRKRFAGGIWLQPCDYGDERTMKMFNKAVQIAKSDCRLRVGIQLHKVLGVR